MESEIHMNYTRVSYDRTFYCLLNCICAVNTVNKSVQDERLMSDPEIFSRSIELFCFRSKFYWEVEHKQSLTCCEVSRDTGNLIQGDDLDFEFAENNSQKFSVLDLVSELLPFGLDLLLLLNIYLNKYGLGLDSEFVK